MNQAPIRPSKAQRMQDFRRRQAPVIVWLMAAVITASMLASRTKGHEFIGLAQAVQHRVSAPVEGTIREVLVKELDSVKSGDLLARLDAARMAGLLERGLVSQEEADLARLTYEGTRARVEHNGKLLTQMDEEKTRAQQRRQDFERSHAGAGRIQPTLAPLEEAAKVAAGLLEELRVEKESMVLRAPAAGEVSQILCREGQSVPDGEPVIVITESVPSEILAFLPEAAARRFRPGSVVRVMGRSNPGRIAESVVTRVGASIQAIPLQLWRDPRVPEYGLPVAVAAVPALHLTPGEVVFVQGGRKR